jgi:hypothetical protein
MNVMTDDEVREFTKKNSWATGVQVNSSDHLYYDAPEANCITLSYPRTPLRVTYFARVIAMLGTYADEAQFSGALLWLRLWNIGSPQLEKSGWRLIERMRMGFGELRPLGVANGHWFRSDEIADLAAFIVPCFVYGWDAYVVPSGADCFAFISHDEFWCVATRKAELHAQLLQDFADVEPRVDSMKERFCRPKNISLE